MNKLKSCDFCKKESDGLNIIRSQFQTKEVKQVCWGCLNQMLDIHDEKRKAALDVAADEFKKWVDLHRTP